MLKKSEKVLEFEKQTLGSILTIIELIGIIAILFVFIGVFLPMWEIKALNESIGFFDMTEGSSVGLLMHAIIVLIAIAPNLIILKFRNDVIDEKKEKKQSALIILIIGAVSLLLTIVFSAINLPMMAIEEMVEYSEILLTSGAGSGMMLFGAVLYALSNMANSLIYYALFNGNIKQENLKKIINLPLKK